MKESEFNIILIDDNEIDTSVNEKLIKLANLTGNVRTFNSSTQALAFLRENHDQLLPFINVVLLDILMPEMNGFACLKKMASMDEPLKERMCVYMLSSSIDRLDIMKADAEPMVRRVLEKPLDVYLLKKILVELKQEFSQSGKI